MPHIYLEYSDNIVEKIDYNLLFNELHTSCCEIGNANISDCKSRVIKLKNYYIGTGDPLNALVHLKIALLEGRDESITKQLGTSILKILRNCYSSSSKSLKLEITIEIKEIPKKLYFK